jgi:hypothetical protein
MKGIKGMIFSVHSMVKKIFPAIDAKLQREAKERETRSLPLAALTETVVGLSP